MASLQACPPCDCQTYGSRTVYNITANAIQQWLGPANIAGEMANMNPATLLAIASIETNGDYTAVSGGTYGIVQISQNMLDAYNCLVQSDFTLNDLIAQGPNIDTAEQAVTISFCVLGFYLYSLNIITYSFAKSATGWNGAMCGSSGSFLPFGSGCGYWPIPTGQSCYGTAAVKLASAYDGWWINPNTGTATSFYWGDLPGVPTNTLPMYNQVCYGD